MLTEDDPEFEDWDQDVAAVEQRYDLQDPAAVSDESLLADEAFARRWAQVGDGDWQRTGDRSDGSSFTTGSFAQYFLHDRCTIWPMSAAGTNCSPGQVVADASASR